ncbi:MAG TPA: hypothetical protein VGJ21_17805 [Terracidiphilus sp.]
MPHEIQEIHDDTLSMPARNLRVTWKALLAFWILFFAVCCLRASSPAPVLNSVGSQPGGTHGMAVGTR